MIKSRDGKHAGEVKEYGCAYREPAPTGEKDPQTAKVQNQERQNPQIIHLIRFFPQSRELGVAVIGVEPLLYGNKAAADCFAGITHNLITLRSTNSFLHLVRLARSVGCKLIIIASDRRQYSFFRLEAIL